MATAFAVGGSSASADPRSDVAISCQNMALQAHPADLRDKSAADYLRRSYYRLCIRRHGIMDPELRNRR